MTPEIVEKFNAMYQTLDKDNMHLLMDVYSDDVVFVDALHEIKGIDALEKYFEGMYQNLEYCKFDIHDVQSNDSSAYLSWKMDYAHPKLGGNKNISVDGVTHLKFDGKVTYHRDYADMGQMLYENIPLLGSAIRLIKKKAVS